MANLNLAWLALTKLQELREEQGQEGVTYEAIERNLGYGRSNVVKLVKELQRERLVQVVPGGGKGMKTVIFLEPLERAFDLAM